ncbi:MULTISPECIES: hypothetical protein [unclassified Actinomadura]|uniref:hypothetical protein n=1 Tax=unclassified Actinomadura TaxID=2626254 RepID=UPI0011EE2F6B|nr:hypothetical protein [Actinomadura sp. K4S16]
MRAHWYFWHRADPEIDRDLVQEMLGEHDGWENCLLPDPSVIDLRQAVLARWPDLADEVYPLNPGDFPAGFEPDPDAPPDLLERVVEVVLFDNRMEREGELVQMAKSRGLSCFEQNTGRTVVP